MGLGGSLAFIAIGAVLAFATRFTVSGIDIRMIGWILMLVGVAGIAFTLMYLRPRRRRIVVSEQIGDEPVYDVRPDEPVSPHIRRPYESPVPPQGPRPPITRVYREE